MTTKCPACGGEGVIRYGTYQYDEDTQRTYSSPSVPCQCVALAASEQRVAELEAERTAAFAELARLQEKVARFHDKLDKALAGEGGKP